MVFEDAMDSISENWSKWTKGMIQKAEGWKNFSNNDAWAANYMPIPEGWETATLPDSWKEFFEGNGGKASPRILHRVYFFIGSCLDATNESQQCLIIADEGGTGKGEFIRLLRDILPKDFIGELTNECLSNPRFAVFSHGLYKHHILVNTEYDGRSTSSELFKQLTGGDTISCEVKNGESFSFNTRGLKMILTSNRICYTKEHSIRRRMIPVSFVSNFDQTAGFDAFKRAQLIKDGPQFLAFCYRMYRKSPYRTSTGDFLVMNREQSEEFKKSRRLPNGREYEKFLMKAFSADTEIGDKFKCGDYSEETHLNDAFEDIYELAFEFDDNANLPVEVVKNKILEICRDRKDLACELDLNWDGCDVSFDSMKKRNNANFIAFMEKTKGHEWNALFRNNGKAVRGVTNIRLKETEHEPTTETTDTTFEDITAENLMDELEKEGAFIGIEK